MENHWYQQSVNTSLQHPQCFTIWLLPPLHDYPPATVPQAICVPNSASCDPSTRRARPRLTPLPSVFPLVREPSPLLRLANVVSSFTPCTQSPQSAGSSESVWAAPPALQGGSAAPSAPQCRCRTDSGRCSVDCVFLSPVSHCGSPDVRNER